MNLTLTLHIVAGLGALGLGLGILLRAPSRARNRNFALLCLAIALWNLGLAGQSVSTGPMESIGRALFFLGSCSTAPLALQFALGLSGAGRGRRRAWLIPAWSLSGGLWVASLTPILRNRALLAYSAIVILGGILVAALTVIALHTRRLAPSPERRALGFVLGGGLIGVGGGLSDFLPRGGLLTTHFGPIAILVFLLTICAVIVRHRFLDVDIFIARGISLLAGAAAMGLTFFAVVRFVDPSAGFGTLLLTSMLVLAVAVPIGRLILTRARSFLSPADPLALALQQVSRRLTNAQSMQDVWKTLEEGRAVLPGDVVFEVYFRRNDQLRFHLVFGARETDRSRPTSIDPSEAVPLLLGRERLPLTRRFLESELRETATPDPLIKDALRRIGELDHRLLVPVLAGDRLSGWIGVGGGLVERHLTAEVATAVLAVGNQTIASLDRIEALEVAKRREAQAAIGELAAGLAHEVRNPVAAIRGAAQAMGPQATTPQREEMLQVIEDETERLGRFVGEFLEYARPASPRRESVDPAEVFASSLRTHQLAGRRIAAEISLVEPAPHVKGDPDQLRRVFDNLLRNSWEAGGEGVRVRLEIHGIEDGRVSIRFEDNGPGISAEEMPRLFQPFHTTKEGGTGLGLAMIHRIVEEHGGEVRVEGRPGIGAAFTFSLPAAAADDPTDEETP